MTKYVELVTGTYEWPSPSPPLALATSGTETFATLMFAGEKWHQLRMTQADLKALIAALQEFVE